MSDKLKAAGAVGLMLAVTAWSYFYFRSVYNHEKRLRVVEPGRLYRCGQLTADGFRDAVRAYGIKTIINVQDDVPEPVIWKNYLDRRTLKEPAVCKELGVRYVWIAPDLVPPPAAQAGARPVAIDQFRDVMDDPANHPVLIHCKAGLHRTGVLCAIYRMEYQGWPRQAALRELRAHGFGDWACTDDNDYVDQYVLRYQRRPARPSRLAGATSRD
jgi:tyrosine-protein phosphatase SIW14